MIYSTFSQICEKAHFSPAWFLSCSTVREYAWSLVWLNSSLTVDSPSSPFPAFQQGSTPTSQILVNGSKKSDSQLNVERVEEFIAVTSPAGGPKAISSCNWTKTSTFFGEACLMQSHVMPGEASQICITTMVRNSFCFSPLFLLWYLRTWSLDKALRKFPIRLTVCFLLSTVCLTVMDTCCDSGDSCSSYDKKESFHHSVCHHPEAEWTVLE